MSLVTDFPRPLPFPDGARAFRGRYRGGATFRLALVTLAGAALLGAALGEGWVQAVLSADVTRLTWVIAALFAAGLGLSFVAARRIDVEIAAAERQRTGPPGSWVGDYRRAIAGRAAGTRANAAAALRARAGAALHPVRHVAASLVLLGLIGTVLGFIMALSGVSAGVAGDVGQVGEMVARLIEGMSVALYTTLEGSVLSLWLTVNHHILSAAAGRLVVRLILEGEADARD